MHLSNESLYLFFYSFLFIFEAVLIKKNIRQHLSRETRNGLAYSSRSPRASEVLPQRDASCSGGVSHSACFEIMADMLVGLAC